MWRRSSFGEWQTLNQGDAIEDSIAHPTLEPEAWQGRRGGRDHDVSTGKIHIIVVIVEVRLGIIVVIVEVRLGKSVTSVSVICIHGH